MRMRQVYVCDFCRHESTDRDEVELCEAKHMGLQSIEEKHQYDALKSAAAHFASVVYSTNNEKTRAAYDTAIKKLLDFEVKHGLNLYHMSEGISVNERMPEPDTMLFIECVNDATGKCCGGAAMYGEDGKWYWTFNRKKTEEILFRVYEWCYMDK